MKTNPIRSQHVPSANSTAPVRPPRRFLCWRNVLITGALAFPTTCGTTGRMVDTREKVSAVERFVPFNRIGVWWEVIAGNLQAAERKSMQKHPFQKGGGFFRGFYSLERPVRYPLALLSGFFEGAFRFVQAEACELSGTSLQYESATRIGYENWKRDAFYLDPFHYGGNEAVLDYLAIGGQPDAKILRPDSQTPMRRTLLDRVVSETEKPNTPATVRALINAGADPHQRNDLGETLLHRACLFDNLSALDALLDLKDRPSIDSPSGEGITPLVFAMQARAPRCFTRLLERGADKTIPDLMGRTATDWLRILPDYWKALGHKDGADFDRYFPLRERDGRIQMRYTMILSDRNYTKEGLLETFRAELAKPR